MLNAIRTDRSLTGIVCVVAGMVVLSVGDSIIKWLSPHLPLHEIVLVRSVVGISLTLVFVQLEGGLGNLRTKRPGLHALRGLLIAFANMLFFLGLASMQIAEAMAIFFIAPLLITALSVPFLGEKVGYRRWLAILVGLIGVLIVQRPGSAVFTWVSLLPAGAALCYAIMQTITRHMGVSEKAGTMAFYIQLMFIIVGALVGVAIGDGRYAGTGNVTLEFLLRAWVWPDPASWALMTAAGCLVAVGGYLLSQAYRTAEANVVAPFEYTALPFGLLFGYLFWDHLPDAVSFLGISLIIVSGVFVVFRERAKGQETVARRQD